MYAARTKRQVLEIITTKKSYQGLPVDSKGFENLGLPDMVKSSDPNKDVRNKATEIMAALNFDANSTDTRAVSEYLHIDKPPTKGQPGALIFLPENRQIWYKQVGPECIGDRYTH
jgi:hypothetical protein